MALYELEGIARAMSRRRYRRNEVVFHQGDPGETLHLVRQGRLSTMAAPDNFMEWMRDRYPKTKI